MKHFAALFIALLSATHAQEAGKQRTCRILYLDRPSTAPETMHLFDGSVSREVDLPGMNLSKVYDLPKGEISLVLLPAPLANPEELPPGAPSTSVPESATDIYLLVMSDPSNKVAPVRLQVVDASAAKLSRGKTLWFNLTEHTVGGTLGTEKLVIKPMSRAVTDAPRKEAGDFPVNLGYRMKGKEHLYPICQTRWNHDPAARSLGFIITRPGSRTPRVLVFPDSRVETSIAGKEDN